MCDDIEYLTVFNNFMNLKKTATDFQPEEAQIAMLLVHQSFIG